MFFCVLKEREGEERIEGRKRIEFEMYKAKKGEERVDRVGIFVFFHREGRKRSLRGGGEGGLKDGEKDAKGGEKGGSSSRRERRETD